MVDISREELKERLEAVCTLYEKEEIEDVDETEPPYIVIADIESNQFTADGSIWYEWVEMLIFFYTDRRDREMEQKIESIMKKGGIISTKETETLKDIGLHETTYKCEVRL